ncbi:hypothetical protein A4D02_28870 [Niastella koreensis]|uniref:TonB C-terminal domain-containing protein n=3 Tax=Niastella koreensis TaxID=354356 RepID=G8T760_NIAKG|nr:hypothetical protein Niako_3791 [Niastella koreensis GR20-10]OQP49606.1 hypothetical protein A4D02_28870 [Niastella koreensis]
MQLVAQRKIRTLFFLLMLAGGGTAFAQQNDSVYVRVDSFPLNTGDLAFNAALDDPGFTVCNSKIVFQYYNTGSYYKQHKREIEHYFKNSYKPVVDPAGGNGYLTIRFIINCSGQTGRFRVYELNTQYQPVKFDPRIASRLLKLTKELRGWQPAVYKDKNYDSYQYITFKLNKGGIACVLP